MGGSGKVSRFFVWILIIGLIVGLAGFSITNFGGGATPVAKVGETEVTADQYYRALRSELNRYSQQFGQNITLTTAVSVGIDQELRQQLYTSAGFDNEAANLGLSVGDEQVANSLTEQTSFQGIDGSFDRQAYDFFLEQNGITEARFEETLRTETTRSLLQQAIATGIVTPEALSNLGMEYIAGRRSFAWGVLTEDSLVEAIAAPSDAQLAEFHAANEADFTLPEKKRISYAWVSPDDLIETLEVPEDELRALYDERAEVYIVPERRMVERLVFADDASATAAKARLDAGEIDFASLVAERGLDLGDIDLGDATRADLGSAADAIFALENTGISAPVESDLGPAIFRVNAILDAREISFEDAESELRSELVAEVARRQIADSLENIEDLLAGGNSLEDLANETDLVLGAIDWSNDVTDGIATYEAFRTAAATLSAGDFETAIELEDGGLFAMRLDETLPPRLQDINEVKPALSEAWHTAEVQKALNVLAEDFTAKLIADEAPETLGMEITVETDATRSTYIDGTPADFMEKVFALEVGGVVSVPHEGSVILVLLTDEAGPDHEAAEVIAMRTGLEAQLAQSLTNDILALVAEKLVVQAGLSINQAVIAAVHTNFPQ
jgi:peptidyl-prolyl cis-trans isomerase D